MMRAMRETRIAHGFPQGGTDHRSPRRKSGYLTTSDRNDRIELSP